MKTVTVTMELTPKELMRLADYLASPHEEEAPTLMAEAVMPDGEAVEIENEKVDKSKLRAIGTAIAKAGGSGELKAVFAKYGAKKLGEIKEEDYVACYRDLEDLRNAQEAL